MRKLFINRIFTLFLCVLLFLSAVPLAFAEEASDERAEEPQFSVINAEELQALTEQAIEELRINPENLSIGYCYTPTGETWYYRDSDWYYSASLYKVPLMMILAEREHNGELTPESNVNGLTLEYAESAVLTWSNNTYAHLMMHYLGSDRECREMYQQFSPMPVEDYVSNFYDYSYFTARFITDVMKTLYYEQERFPNIVECLKNAQPDHWFKRTGDNTYEIAQKYGSYEEFNHTSGIVYTPNPFILTVMTRNCGSAESRISDLKQRFQDYTLQLDERLETAREEQAAREAEEARRQREEEERLALERAQAEQRASEEPEETPDAALSAGPETEGVKPLFIGGVVVLAVLAAVGIAAAARKRPVASGRRGSRYTPRH